MFILAYENKYIPISFELIYISNRNIFFRINSTRSITFQGISIIFPVLFSFSEDLNIGEIKTRLCEFYNLNIFENIKNNFVGNLNKNEINKKKKISKNLKNMVKELFDNLKIGKLDNFFFGDIEKINKIFLDLN